MSTYRRCSAKVAWRQHRGHQFASSALMDPMTRSFVAETERYAKDRGVPMIQFQKGQRKDDVMAAQLKRFEKSEGVVFIGKAQEKTPVFRTERPRNPNSGQQYPWIVRSTAMVNHYYWYCGSGVRPVFPEVLLLFSLQRQALFERPRIC
jgi:hypothetical protein